MIFIFIYFIFSLFLLAVNRRRNYGIIFSLISVGTGVLSFFYFPPEQGDLYRHFEKIEFYGEMSLSWVLENRCNINPLSELLFYAFSFLGEPRFYASFSAIVVYGFIGLLLYRISKFYSLSKSTFLIISAFLLLNWNYLMVVSNCRIFMLYSIIAYFYYMEFIENKYHKSAFIVYILSLFFHYGIALIVFPRFLLYLYKPTNKKVYLWMLIILAIFIYNSDIIFQSVLLDSVSDKIDEYKNYTTFGRLQFFNSLYSIIICCICVVFSKYNSSQVRRYSILFWLTILLLVFQINNYQVVYRESNIIASLSLIIFSQAENYRSKNNILLKNILIVQTLTTFVYYLVYEYQFIEFQFII